MTGVWGVADHELVTCLPWIRLDAAMISRAVGDEQDSCMGQMPFLIVLSLSLSTICLCVLVVLVKLSVLAK